MENYAAVGRSPIPPYWALGFHLCRYGYNTIENMKAAVDRTAAANIPHVRYTCKFRRINKQMMKITSINNYNFN